MTAGLIAKHQPGTAGMSQLDLVTIPTLWTMPLDYERRVTARADAGTVDAGGSGANLGKDALLGTADLGTTPLGFLLNNVVGGVEWTPRWNSAAVRLGVSRRAVTNSELSFAGLRDPITGTPWGGVVQTGPYGGLALYRDRYSISGSVQADAVRGTHVQSNQFIGAHAAADWKFISSPTSSLAAGEREIVRGLAVGGTLEIDRTDYYHPTSLSPYIRHAFGSADTRPPIHCSRFAPSTRDR